MKHVIALGLAFGLVACDENPTPTKEAVPTAAPTAAATATSTGPTTTVAAKGPFTTSSHPAMKDPSLATEKAPDTFTAKFETTAGDFEMKCTREWAPHGADRFYNLVKIGFYDDVAFFRAVSGFMVQFGIHGDPEVSKHWSSANIEPDKIVKSNTRGMVTFAQAGRPAGEGLTANARSTQVFINYGDNARLDGMGFAPICEVAKGMDVVDKIHQGYGEAPSREQPILQSQGNKHLRSKYPELDYIKTARIVEGEEGAGGGAAEADDKPEAQDDKPAEGKDAKAPEPKEPKEPKAPKAPEGNDAKAPAPTEPPKAPGKGDGSGTGKGDGSGSGSGKGDGSGQGQ